MVSDYFFRVGDNPSSAAPLLRGILHECDRFSRHDADATSLSTFAEASSTGAKTDPSLAFATIKGSALFYMGRLIQADPDIASPGEPTSPDAYFQHAINILDDALWCYSRADEVKAESDRAWKTRLEFTLGQSILLNQEDAEPPLVRINRASQLLTSAATELAAGEANLSPIHLRREIVLPEVGNVLLATIDEADDLKQQRKWQQWILESLLPSRASLEEEPELVILRGKCHLALGETYASECEDRLTEDDDTVWQSNDAKAGRSQLDEGRHPSRVSFLPVSKDQ